MSMMDWTGVDFTGLANLNIGDLRDPQGRYPMDAGYDPASTTSDGSKPPPDKDKPILDAWGRDPSNPNYGVDLNAKKEDARLSIKGLLAKYKIPGLFDTIWGAYTGDTLDFTNEDAVTLYIRETPEYKKRFAGNEARRAKGLPDLSIATYIGIEDSYRNTLKANGMPANMYNEENMAELIGGDVDVKEFNDRISYARDVMMDSPAGVRAQMSELYGITEGQMLAYFVDPERTAPILKEQARGARIGNIAKENARIQLTGAEATDLAKRGITDTEAETAFANISDYRELNTQLSGEETITQSEKIGSELGYDPLGKQKLKNRQKRRVGEFAGGGGFAQSQALGGALKSGVGSAE